MRMLFTSLVALSALAAQNATNQPKFEVASVKVGDRSSLGRGGGRGPAGGGGPGTSDPGRFDAPVDSMKGLLMKAFGAESAQIVYPGWNNGNFYAVTAAMPPDTTKAQFQAMLQNLLTERFHLAVHHETRNFPAYELVVDKGGPKLKEAPPPEDAPAPAGPQTFVGYADVGNVAMKYQTMGDLANELGMALRTAEMIRTQDLTSPTPRVVDRTGLTGRYTFTMEFATDPDSPAASLPDLFAALRKQLGLRLDKTAGVPVDVIVVDHVDKVPVPN
jgi:uncharacterized protein (TIGR03435 family)